MQVIAVGLAACLIGGAAFGPDNWNKLTAHRQKRRRSIPGIHYRLGPGHGGQ